MDAAGYDAWYATPRGAWIGGAEFRLLQRTLQPVPGESLLDVGCGTGYFTRRFAGGAGLQVVGVDPNRAWLDFARSRRVGDETYCAGRAECLPFADRSFDRTVSVTALCFVDDARTAVSEILRVTRKRFAIGLLNRRSLLYRDKGRGGGSGAYRGAHWHTPGELRELFAGFRFGRLTVRSAIFVSKGMRLAETIEWLAPSRLLLGAFIVVAGDAFTTSDRDARSCVSR
jgi:SAM-dependent methyltransferase